MTDYIKREDAINTVRNTFTGMTADTLELRINDLPSADVAPVRHGRWIDKIYGGKECSECGYIWLDFGCPKYCPKCGARMDGERKNDDKSCDTCKHYDKGWDDIICDGCTKAHSNWERKDDE